MDPNANRLQPMLCTSSATTWTIVIAILAPGATKVLITHHATTVAAPLWRFANHPDWVVATYDVAPYASASSSVMPAGYPTLLLAEMALAEDPPAVTAWDASGKTVLRMP